MDIHKKIRQTREQYQFTQEDMAEKLEIPASTYAKIERGNTKLTFDILQQIANVFNIDICKFVDLEERSKVIILGAENGDNTVIYAANETIAHEIERLKTIIRHKEEIITQKDKQIALLEHIVKNNSSNS